MKPFILFALFLSCAATFTPQATAQASTIAREGVEQIIRAFGQTAGREVSKETAEQLAKIVGRESMEKLCTAVSREGGDTALLQLAKVANKTGAEGILALNNVTGRATILSQLDELPAGVARTAASRLAAGTEGLALGELAERYGSIALRTEARHPGVGSLLIRDLGQEGIELAGKLTTTQAQQLAAISREIAILPPAQQASVYRAITENSTGFFKWAGQLIKDNPGKIILSTAAVYELNTHWDSIIGTPNAPGFIPTVIANTVGKPVTALSDGVSTAITFLVPTILIAVALWLIMTLRHRYRLHKLAEEKARKNP